MIIITIIILINELLNSKKVQCVGERRPYGIVIAFVALSLLVLMCFYEYVGCICLRG